MVHSSTQIAQACIVSCRPVPETRSTCAPDRGAMGLCVPGRIATHACRAFGAAQREWAVRTLLTRAAAAHVR
ncbi:hypothetical protein C0Z19_22095 [Trinickia soli]|uniref:Uncharacterized protein n=1 Tax=Trinickia soli TaxID=380675 RepID=A0A2N7VP53_9BURK|nr:hypothetical protein CIW54_15990 [Paraburkholderia sp. T12-10]PMS18940.1 hypothetical protein C0Z19_22095 [Trinickia soli]